MILTGSQIKAETKKGTITLAPFQEELLNPNSYNYCLGSQLVVIDEQVIDPKKLLRTQTIDITEDGYVLMPGTLYLGHTLETIGSSRFVPSLIGRSSLGRLGLFLQITADLGHLGTCHKWTLELKVVQPLRVYRDMRIGQVSFWQPKGTIPNSSYADRPDSYARYSASQPSIMEKFFI